MGMGDLCEKSRLPTVERMKRKGRWKREHADLMRLDMARMCKEKAEMSCEQRSVMKMRVG